MLTRTPAQKTLLRLKFLWIKALCGILLLFGLIAGTGYQYSKTYDQCVLFDIKTWTVVDQMMPALLLTGALLCMSVLEYLCQ